MKKNRSFGNRGFTMLEMLMVVAIMALLAGVGGGLYRGAVQGMLVKKSAREFYLAARYARMMAIEKQRPYKIVLNTENNTYSVVSENINEQTGQAEVQVVKNYYMKPVKFKGDIKFENIQIFSGQSSFGSGESGQAGFGSDNPVKSIVFLPNGTALASTVQIGDGKTHYTASVCPSTGRVKVYSGSSENVESQVIDLDMIR
jgi:prepilin-type N-terminal cleavage/methylation domain-containing protein